MTNTALETTDTIEEVTLEEVEAAMEEEIRKLLDTGTTKWDGTER